MNRESSALQKPIYCRGNVMSETTVNPAEFPHLSLVDLDRGNLIETLWRPNEVLFALCQGEDQFSIVPEIEVNGAITKPRDVRHFVEQKLLFLPSDIGDYSTQEDLIRDIISFVHRYADVPAFWEELIAHYILMTWMYDRFTATPYLRFLGEPGTGKTRIQQVCGRLCYKGMFVAGSISAAGIFRLCDAVRGTLVVDEGDFRSAGDWSDIVKVLNQGYMAGAPILRCEGEHGRYDLRGYVVFGPKLIATRNRFDTDALETRCLTLQTTRVRLRSDIPLQLPLTFEAEACALRNRLLRWRFRNLRLVKTDESRLRHLESRI